MSSTQGFRRGFTLAEVLITLGIIGVVAALTLPSMIAKHKQMEMMTRLKREYAVLSQVMQRAKMDHGDINNWDLKAGADYRLSTYFLPYLSGAKLCAPPSTDCGVYQEIQFDGNPYASPYKRQLMLNSGATLTFTSQTTGGITGSPDRYFDSRVLALDVNGLKGPNKNGIDVYYFDLTQNYGYSTTYYSYPEGFYFHGKGRSESEIKAGCKSSGRMCGLLYQSNGWQVPDDIKW